MNEDNPERRAEYIAAVERIFWGDFGQVAADALEAFYKKWGKSWIINLEWISEERKKEYGLYMYESPPGPLFK